MMGTVGKRWFVILRSYMGLPLPLVDLEDEMAVFDSEAAARAAGKRNIIGEAFGFEVYEWRRECA